MPLPRSFRRLIGPYLLTLHFQDERFEILTERIIQLKGEFISLRPSSA